MDPDARLTLEQIFLSIVGGEERVAHPEQELAWLSPDSTWDFSLDEIAFYSGTPPAGAVGPNPSAPTSDDAGAPSSNDSGTTVTDASGD